MFETVVPEVVSPRSRRLFYEMLPFSIAIHLLLAAAAIGASIWNVTFPKQSPKLYAAYQLIADPPPPPPPPPPPLRRQVVPQQKVVPIKMPEVAPTVIPDLIPQVPEPVTEVPDVPIGDEGGQKGGVEGGVAGGEIGGDLGGVAIPTIPVKLPEPAVIQVQRDAPLPMGAISQEYPGYPEYALRRNWEDQLVVRYTIGKDGRVKEVEVIDPPDREEFSREAVSKIRHWRFHPYIGENGQPKEVTHELTVVFKIARKKKQQS